ncbi:MAG: FAD-binding oxidoreductase, partial [Anaerolineales bacterium]
MRRWNGWGDSEIRMAVPSIAIPILEKYLGKLQSYPDCSFEDVLKRIGEADLPDHPKIDTTPQTRLFHSRGQSLPDWIALRYGYNIIVPDGVTFPTHAEELREIISFAKAQRIFLIPYGGGTSVVGHINPLAEYKPVLTVSLEKMNQLLNLDEFAQVATFQAGVNGPSLEKQLRSHGYTLGHYPQSFEYSTLGGWIATRSSGQQSYYYGRIERLFAGGEVETPCGTLRIPHYPASAAGPNLAEIVLGSEGRLGIISQATLRVRKIPQDEAFLGVFFPAWEAGLKAVHRLAQDNVGVSMLRLSNPLETDINLYLSGKRWVEQARQALGWIGYGSDRCMLIFGLTGSVRQNKRVLHETMSVCRKFGGLYLGKLVGKTWQKSRFLTPYLRNSLWEIGVAVDTLETALPWSQVMAAEEGIIQAIR